MRYGLVTDETSAVLVKMRAAADKVQCLPTIRPVAHIVPEGMVLSAASRYLADVCPDGVDHASAIELLRNLLDEWPDIVLSDDQEASFSLLIDSLELINSSFTG